MMTHDDRKARLNAEVSLLGAAMLDNVVVGTVAPTLDGVVWANPSHGRIWRAMVELTASAMPVDTMTLMDSLGSDLEGVGGVDYLVTLDQAAATSVNVEHYANIVASLSRKAAFVNAMRGCASAVMSADSTSWTAPAGEAIGAMAAAMATGPMDARQTSTEIADEMIRRWQDAEAGIFHGQRLGWHPGGDTADYKDGQGYCCAIDEAWGGVEAGHLVVIGARPKHGKSTLLATIMGNLCDRGKRVLGWFGEEPLPDIASRLVHRKARRVFADRARRGKLDATNGDHDRLIQGVKAYRDYRLHLIDGRVTTKVGGVIAEAMRIKAIHGDLDMVVIDQATLIDPSQGKHGKLDAARYYDICAELKQAAPNIGAPIILLSQVKQEVEKRPDKRPTSGDMHGADAFVQYADRLMMLYRLRRYDKDALPIAELRMVANRHGETGVVYLTDRTEFGHFTDLTPDLRRQIEAVGFDGG